MASYQCPYCNTSILHRPELAGSRVACSHCGGLYYEPTDPLPGVKPIKAPKEPGENVPVASVAKAPVLAPAEDDSDITNDMAGREPKSSKVLMPYEMAGQKALVISWNEAAGRGAKVGTTRNANKDEANDMILRIAMKLIKRRWPEIYPLLSVRVDKELNADN